MPTTTQPTHHRTRSVDAVVDLHLPHRVRFTTDALNPENPTLADLIADNGPHKILPCVDQGVLDHHPQLPSLLHDYTAAHPDKLEPAGPNTPIPGGEIAKNDHAIFESIIRNIHDAGLCRHSYILAIGGGAVLDAVGFAASIAHRGVRLIRVPTTTLAQADSGVGVKNGINAFGQKNFLGSFAPPWAVINDADFLATLSDRDWRAGLSEAVKVALVKDPQLLDRIIRATDALRSRDQASITPIIRRSAELHLQHITQSGDPFELTTARPLDFGHWAAHRLETLTDYQLRHGEAVAIGIALDCTYAALAGLLPQDQADLIINTLQNLGFATHHRALRDTTALLQGLDEFRMHLGGRLSITLLKGIGHPIDADTMDEGLIAHAAQHLRNTAPQP